MFKLLKPLIRGVIPRFAVIPSRSKRFGIFERECLHTPTSRSLAIRTYEMSGWKRAKGIMVGLQRDGRLLDGVDALLTSHELTKLENCWKAHCQQQGSQADTSN